MKKIIEAKRGTLVPTNAKFMYSEKRPIIGKLSMETWDIFEVMLDDKEVEKENEKQLSDYVKIKLGDLNL